MGIGKLTDRVQRFGDEHRRELKPESVWLPDADSPLWDVYTNWYKRRGQSVGAKVGRCHFWHIMVLSFLAAIGRLLSKTVGVSFLFAVVTLALIVGLEVLLVASGAPVLDLHIVVLAFGGIVGAIIGIAAYVGLVDAGMTVRKLIKEITDKDTKMSFGVALVLLTGPAIMVGLIVAYFLHNTVRVLGKLPPVRLFVEYFEVILAIIMMIGAVALAVFLGWLFYTEVVVSQGWVAGLIWIAAGIGAIAAVCAIFALMVFVGGFLVEAVKKNNRKKQAKREAAGIPASESAVAKTVAKTGRGFRGLWHAIRLFATFVEAAYKQVCPVGDVPDKHQTANREDKKEQSSSGTVSVSLAKPHYL